MTPSPSDSLVFKLAGGQTIPCAAESVSVVLSGEAAELVDRELVQNAAAAVLYYFKNELHRSSVSAAEFSTALEKVLHGFGLTHLKTAPEPDVSAPRIVDADLRVLAADGLELLFFPRLRDELRRGLAPLPQIFRFHGLRRCVKHLTGAKRWSPRCQRLSDQIVEHLRAALGAEGTSEPCGLVVV